MHYFDLIYKYRFNFGAFYNLLTLFNNKLSVFFLTYSDCSKNWQTERSERSDNYSLEKPSHIDLEFQSCRASRRVLTSGSIVSGISFCNSLFVVSLSKVPKIAIKFALFGNLPSSSLIRQNFSARISKLFHGPMSSTIKPTVGKLSHRHPQQQQQQPHLRRGQNSSCCPYSIIGPLPDRGSGEPGIEPSIQPQQSILQSQSATNPGQSFAIEHRVREKKSKFRPLLGAAVEDPKRFVPFVLEASG